MAPSARSARTSAGLLLCRRRGRDAELEFLLVHPGGPYFARRDLGAWSIPKGLLEPGEVQQRGGKRVLGFAALGDAEVSSVRRSSASI